ncbi:unnamed protein product [Ixodes hexagonus]
MLHKDLKTSRTMSATRRRVHYQCSSTSSVPTLACPLEGTALAGSRPFPRRSGAAMNALWTSFLRPTTAWKRGTGVFSLRSGFNIQTPTGSSKL